MEIFICGRCEGNIEEAVEQEEKLYTEVEMVRDVAYLGKQWWMM